MKQDHFLQSKAAHEKEPDLIFPRSGWLISERGSVVERLPARRGAGSRQEPSPREGLESSSRELAVRSGDYDEADRAKSPQLPLELARYRYGRMEDQLTAGKSEYRHSNRDPDQAGLPAEFVLGAPEVRVVLDQRQSTAFLLPDGLALSYPPRGRPRRAPKQRGQSTPGVERPAPIGRGHPWPAAAAPCWAAGT